MVKEVDFCQRPQEYLEETKLEIKFLEKIEVNKSIIDYIQTK